MEILTMDEAHLYSFYSSCQNGFTHAASGELASGYLGRTRTTTRRAKLPLPRILLHTLFKSDVGTGGGVEDLIYNTVTTKSIAPLWLDIPFHGNSIGMTVICNKQSEEST